MNTAKYMKGLKKTDSLADYFGNAGENFFPITFALLRLKYNMDNRCQILLYNRHVTDYLH